MIVVMSGEFVAERLSSVYIAEGDRGGTVVKVLCSIQVLIKIDICVFHKLSEGLLTFCGHHRVVTYILYGKFIALFNFQKQVCQSK